MILNAGLTPAWQQILSFEEFQPGEVNRATHAAWCGSGKVLNVACALRQLGADSKSLCLIGGATGQQIRDDFQRLEVHVRWVESQVPTRTCTTILDVSTGATTELVENSQPIASHELDSFFHAFVEDVSSATTVVLTGSLPKGTPANFYRRLLERTSARTVLDIRGAELSEVLPLRPYVVKPNREELAATVGRDLKSDSDLTEAMAEIRDRGAEWVVVSRGPEPLLALGPDGMHRIQPPSVNVVNPIGCGDCLAAGIAAGIDRGCSMIQSLQWGVRAAGENAQELLPARHLSRLP